ncbi:hypothetical protein ACHAXS_005616 [Conticribra weissflogii]
MKASNVKSYPSQSSLNHGETNREVFPSRLYTMLESLHEFEPSYLNEAGMAVAWLPHGHAFKIHNVDEFMKVIRIFFNQTKLRSFTRQLNNWGFKRVEQGRDRGAWFHKHFIRGRPDELKRINRVTIENKSVEQTTNDINHNGYYYLIQYSVPRSGIIPAEAKPINAEVLLNENTCGSSTALSHQVKYRPSSNWNHSVCVQSHAPSKMQKQITSSNITGQTLAKCTLTEKEFNIVDIDLGELDKTTHSLAEVIFCDKSGSYSDSNNLFNENHNRDHANNNLSTSAHPDFEPLPFSRKSPNSSPEEKELICFINAMITLL